MSPLGTLIRYEGLRQTHPAVVPRRETRLCSWAGLASAPRGHQLGPLRPPALPASLEKHPTETCDSLARRSPSVPPSVLAVGKLCSFSSPFRE